MNGCFLFLFKWYVGKSIPYMDAMGLFCVFLRFWLVNINGYQWNIPIDPLPKYLGEFQTPHPQHIENLGPKSLESSQKKNLSRSLFELGEQWTQVLPHHCCRKSLEPGPGSTKKTKLRQAIGWEISYILLMEEILHHQGL